MQEKNISKKSKIIKIILSVVLLICFVGAVSYIIIHNRSSNKNKDLYSKLQEEMTIDKEAEEIAQVTNKFVDKVKELQQENEDIKGWIQIEDTNINYPLLQATDNDYYLGHNYKKEKSKYGSIFINSNCNIKDNNSNSIIYGHNLKDGQMFNDLIKYQNKEFYEKHSIIKIITDESEEEYEIIVAFKSRVFYQDEENVFRYYRYYNFEDENKYNEYINNCKKIQLYDTGKTAMFGEQLITLSTCEYSQENGRMVIVAKRK